MRLGGLDFTVIGVAPAGFRDASRPSALLLRPDRDVAIAQWRTSGSAPAARGARILDVRGRLESGVSLEQAQEETALVARGLEQAYPDTNRNYGMLVRTGFDARLEERGPSAPSAFMLLALAFVVLLVACANVAGLLMSRAPARERELALRLAIGGGRLR